MLFLANLLTSTKKTKSKKIYMVCPITQGDHKPGEQTQTYTTNLG